MSSQPTANNKSVNEITHKTHSNQQQGVRHTVALPLTLKKCYLKAKEELYNESEHNILALVAKANKSLHLQKHTHTQQQICVQKHL
jgi:hypothetical protein